MFKSEQIEVMSMPWGRLYQGSTVDLPLLGLWRGLASLTRK